MKLSIPNWIVATFVLASMGHTDPGDVAVLIFDRIPAPEVMERIGSLICRIEGGVFDEFKWPFGYGNLARPVRCKGCGGLVNVVPCVVCNPPEDDEEEARAEQEATPWPPAPTEHLPGSEAKIEVMRQRVLAGYSPWHPLDSYVEPTPPPVETPCVRVDLTGMESSDAEV